mgnify:CR=1 FL=1
MAEEKQAARETMRTKLREAMADMVNPTKSKTASVPTKSGKSYQYQYTTLAEVLGIVRPALQEHGLGLRQSIGFAETGLTLRTDVFDEESDMTLDERPVYENKDPQGFGSYETYMRRYSLLTAFGLAADDDDGQAAVKSNYQPKRSEEIKFEKRSAHDRIEKGIKALCDISPWTRETLAPMLDGMDEAAQVQWLADAYREAKAQMAEAQR